MTGENGFSGICTEHINDKNERNEENRFSGLYAGARKSEYIAVDHLKKKYIKIQRNKDGTPDFICLKENGGVDRVEVKRVQAGIIIFTENQARKMRDDDIVLVVDDEKVIGEFRWRDRRKVPWRIKVREDKKVQLRMALDEDLFFQLEELKAKMRCRSWEEFVRRVVDKGYLLTKDIIY